MRTRSPRGQCTGNNEQWAGRDRWTQLLEKDRTEHERQPVLVEQSAQRVHGRWILPGCVRRRVAYGAGTSSRVQSDPALNARRAAITAIMIAECSPRAISRGSASAFRCNERFVCPRAGSAGAAQVHSDPGCRQSHGAKEDQRAIALRRVEREHRQGNAASDQTPTDETVGSPPLANLPSSTGFGSQRVDGDRCGCRGRSGSMAKRTLTLARSCGLGRRSSRLTASAHGWSPGANCRTFIPALLEVVLRA